MAYDKPWISFSNQLQQLKDRGMLVEDDSAAENYLDRIGYYRLSGYWYPFRQIDAADPKKRLDDFEDGTHFTDALDLYVFDKKLRLLAMDALERIEVAIRVDIAHLLGERDAFAYQDKSLLDGKFSKPKKNKTSSAYGDWLKKHTHLIQRSREPFIKNFKAKYGLPLPFWIAIEVWDFGAMSIFYAGMKGKDRDFIAQKYKVSAGNIFASWLRSLNYLRNLCAHHSLLWNRNMVDQPKLPDATDAADLASFIGHPKSIARPFILFCLLQWLMREICPNSCWHERFRQHLESFPAGAKQLRSLSEMGCPAGWESWDLWKI